MLRIVNDEQFGILLNNIMLVLTKKEAVFVSLHIIYFVTC